MIWAVRDPIEASVPIREKGRIREYQSVLRDRGVTDKRLLVLEPEFARLLRSAERFGSTLSPLLRQAWDSGHLRTLTQKNPVAATGAHISVVGHITHEELEREFSQTACANGFGNRFLWACVKRSKLLPEGAVFGFKERADASLRLLDVVWFARTAGALNRDSEARELWRAVYPQLADSGRGIAGAILSRAEPQVMRLSCLYALLVRSREVRAEHLRAALAVWRYCAASVEFLFGASTKRTVPEQILVLLRERGSAGVTRNEIREYFRRNRRAEQLERALAALEAAGVARSARLVTSGRPAEVWFAV